MRPVVAVVPAEQRRQFRRPVAQRAAQMQGAPKDDMFGDFSRRAQTRDKPSLQLFLGERNGALEGLLVVLPTFEGARASAIADLVISTFPFAVMRQLVGEITPALRAGIVISLVY